MKKTFSVLAAALLVLISSGSFAQFGGKSVNPFNMTNSDLDKLVAMAPLPANLNSLSGSSLKAAKDFRRTFKNVADERWYTTPEGVSAHFSQDGVKTRVEYDKKGHWVATFRYFDESRMPKDVRTLVRSTYFDYAITGVIEIQYDGVLAHIVQISNSDGFKNIRVVDGEMSIYQEFDNANK